MPTKKNTIEFESEEKVVDPEVKSLDSYARFKKISRPMYYRMKYEIRDNPKQKKTYEEWDKLYDKVKF